MTVGLTIMRIQPLHNGHKYIINKMLAENEKGILVIGSIGVKDERNPFTYEERREMVEAVFAREIAEGRLMVCGVKDIHNPPKWVEYIQSQVPVPFDRYYYGFGQDGDLFKAKNIEVCEIPRTAEDISATGVREKIRTGNPAWKNEVPPEVSQWIVKHMADGSKINNPLLVMMNRGNGK